MHHCYVGLQKYVKSCTESFTYRTTADTIARMRILLSLALFSVAWAQQPPTEPAKPRTPPEPKNLKVLKVPASEILPLMRAYSTALGVRCNHCHIQGDFASDENHHKEIARMMISMTQEINAKFEGDKAHVSCFTCHRGDTEPKLNPPAAIAPPAAGAPPAPPTPPAP